MDDRPDPISQFFPDQDSDSVDLYAVLSVTSTATPDEIKKAYRKLALLHHPDKHATAGEAAKEDASLKFQQIGFAYSIISDEKKRARYDRTGKTDDGADFLDPGEGGWEAYFEDLFERVTKEKLDELKKEYQGSEEEVQDLKSAYVEAEGDIEVIMQHIPHSTFDDEARFIKLISELIKSKELPSYKKWDTGVKDEKAKLVRKKQHDKEAVEAEEMAKELGVWDEFYGSGKPSARKTKPKGKGKGKGKAKGGEEEDAEEEDHSALQALILKRKKNMDSFFDGLAAKYADVDEPPKSKGRKGKKRSKEEDEEEEVASPKKRSRKDAPSPPEIDDAEFEALQKRLFADKSKESGHSSAAKGRKTKKGR